MRFWNVADRPCVVFSHQSFERERGGVANYPAGRGIIDEANRTHPGRVRFVVNGHEHKDFLRVLDGVVYLDLNSANYDIFSKPHDRYPGAFTKKYGGAPWLLTWNDPLSAAVTLSVDGRLKIEGTESSFYLGVTPSMAGYGGDPCGRVTVPKIQSADFTFNCA